MQGDDLQKQLNKEIAENLAKIEHTKKIASLTKEFPDLRSNTNRWKKVYYSSALANEQAKHALIYHSCGCCNDAPLFISPYFVHACGIEIYSEPYRFFIGEKCSGGDREDHEWRKTLETAKLPASIISQVEAYFHVNSPSEYDE